MDESPARYRLIVSEVQKSRLYSNYFFLLSNILILAIGVYFHANVDLFYQMAGTKVPISSVSPSSSLSLIYLIFFPVVGIFVSLFWYGEQQSLLRQERRLIRTLLRYERETPSEDSKSFSEIEWDLTGHEIGREAGSYILTRMRTMIILIFVYFHITLIAIAMYRVFTFTKSLG
jgi:hypothetical protein